MRLDDGREVDFDLKDYGHIDHGYASTIHKAQGVTVDRAHVLATPGLDRHGAYVALSRHRDGVALHYGADDFVDRGALDRTLGRERAKDTTLDYAQAFAERRDIHVPVEMQRAKAPAMEPEPEPEPEKKVDRWAGFRRALQAQEAAQAQAPAAQEPPALSPTEQRNREASWAILAYARAWEGLDDIHASGRKPTPEERQAYLTIEARLKGVSEELAKGAHAALTRDPALARASHTSEGLTRIVKATVEEAELLRSPELRADRFVADYAAVRSRHAELAGPGRGVERQELDLKLKSMLLRLDDDPAVKAVLEARQPALEGGRAAEREIARAIGRERDRGMERER